MTYVYNFNVELKDMAHDSVEYYKFQDLRDTPSLSEDLIHFVEACVHAQYADYSRSQHFAAKVDSITMTSVED